MKRGGARRGAGRGKAYTQDDVVVRSRKLLAEAIIAECEAERAQRLAVASADVAKQNAAALSVIRSRLLALGPRLGAQVALESDAATCSTLIGEAVAEALQELSSALAS